MNSSIFVAGDVTMGGIDGDGGELAGLLQASVDTHGQSPWHFVTQALLDALRAITHSPTGKARGTLPFGFNGAYNYYE